MNVYDPRAPKKATNVTVNSDLLAQAKALKINLSAVLEKSLAEYVRVLKTEAWLRENGEAISTFNRDVELHGTFGESVSRYRRYHQGMETRPVTIWLMTSRRPDHQSKLVLCQTF